MTMISQQRENGNKKRQIVNFQLKSNTGSVYLIIPVIMKIPAGKMKGGHPYDPVSFHIGTAAIYFEVCY